MRMDGWMEREQGRSERIKLQLFSRLYCWPLSVNTIPHYTFMTSSNRDVAADASTETFSFTDSSIGGNAADSSLSWGMQIIPQQQQQQRKPTTSNNTTDFTYQTRINLNLNPKLKFKSRIEPVATTTTIPIPIIPPSPSWIDKEWIEKHLLHLPQQVLQSIIDDLESSKPSHSASQTVIPLLPLLDLHPGKSHGSFRGTGHSRQILNTWLGIELQRTDFHLDDGFSLDKDKGSGGGEDDRDREKDREVTFSLPTLIQSKAQIREMRSMQAIRNGERIREREVKEEKREERRKRRLLKGKLKQKNNRGGERDSRKNIDDDVDVDDQVIKMEVDDEEIIQDQLESNDQPSSSSTSTSLNPPTPWDLAIQARRRTARLQLRNDLTTELKPLLESLTILDSISSAEEWSFPFLRPPPQASRGEIWPDGDASASGRDYNLNFNDGLELDQRMRIQRERERERNGVYEDINASTQTETAGVNHQRSNPSPMRRNHPTGTNRNRSIRTVPDLMRESWNSTSTNPRSHSSPSSRTLR